MSNGKPARKTQPIHVAWTRASLAEALLRGFMGPEARDGDRAFGLLCHAINAVEMSHATFPRWILSRRC